MLIFLVFQLKIIVCMQKIETGTKKEQTGIFGNFPYFIKRNVKRLLSLLLVTSIIKEVSGKKLPEFHEKINLPQQNSLHVKATTDQIGSRVVPFGTDFNYVKFEVPSWVVDENQRRLFELEIFESEKEETQLVHVPDYILVNHQLDLSMYREIIKKTDDHKKIIEEENSDNGMKIRSSVLSMTNYYEQDLIRFKETAFRLNTLIRGIDDHKKRIEVYRKNIEENIKNIKESEKIIYEYECEIFILTKMEEEKIVEKLRKVMALAGLLLAVAAKMKKLKEKTIHVKLTTEPIYKKANILNDEYKHTIIGYENGDPLYDSSEMYDHINIKLGILWFLKDSYEDEEKKMKLNC